MGRLSDKPLKNGCAANRYENVAPGPDTMNQSRLISLPSIESHVHDCIQAANTYLPDFSRKHAFLSLVRLGSVRLRSQQYSGEQFTRDTTQAGSKSLYHCHVHWSSCLSCRRILWTRTYSSLPPPTSRTFDSPISSPVSIWLTGLLPLMLH